MAVEPAPSLHDTLTANAGMLDSPAPAETAVTTAPETPSTPAFTSQPADGGEVKVDTRSRDDAGRFAKTPAPAAKTDAPATTPAVATPAAAIDDLNIPSSWKAELKTHWPTLPREVKQEILRRESDALRGISTYKQAYDSVKPVMDALHEHRDMLAASKVQPHEFVGRMANWHKTLASNDPAAKLRAFAQFSQEYGVPLHELFVQGEDGKVYLNQSYFQQQQSQQKPAQSLTPEAVDERVAQHLAREKLGHMINEFVAAKDQSGNPLHPHAKAVWSTIDGLLRSGVVTDLPSAYRVALAAPQHADLATPSPVESEADKLKKAQEAIQAAARAKANAVSPRSQNQTELTVDPSRANNGLRSVIEAAADAHLGGARV